MLTVHDEIIALHEHIMYIFHGFQEDKFLVKKNNNYKSTLYFMVKF